jgi:hypothetical protein
MPTVGSGKKKKTFPYTKAGMAAASAYRKRIGTKAKTAKKKRY